MTSAVDSVSPSIFLSYRRTDRWPTRVLHERLQAHYGHGSVYLDIEIVGFWHEVRDQIRQHISACSVLLVVVSDSWRVGDLEDESDYVRFELQEAVNQGKPILPVLVGDAQMPKANALPSHLRQEVLKYNAIRMRASADLDYDIADLIQALDGRMAEISTQIQPEVESEELIHYPTEAWWSRVLRHPTLTPIGPVDLLVRGERIKYWERRSPALVFYELAFLGLFSTLVAPSLLQSAVVKDQLGFSLPLPMALGLFFLSMAVLLVRWLLFDLVLLTDRRVIRSSGILFRRTRSITYASISWVTHKDGPIGSIADYSSVYIATNSFFSTLRLRFLAKPAIFIATLIDLNSAVQGSITESEAF